jgi:heptosyltransferase-2
MPQSSRGRFNAARPIDTWVGLAICAVLFAWSRLAARFGAPRLPPMRGTTPPPAGLEPPPARRILCIKSYGLGNVVMLLPVLQTLRRTYPEAEIDFLTLEENRILLERSGLVDHTLGINMRAPVSLVRSLAAILWAVRKRGYDLVLDFEQFIKLSAIIAFLSGAPARVGFNTDGQRRAWLYTTRVVYTDGDHMSRIFMRILRAIGITEPSTGRVHIRTEPAEEARVDALLHEAGVAAARSPLIAIHVGSGPNFYEVPLKRWPTAHFAQLCDALAERHGATILLTGKGSEERELVEQTRRLMRQPAVDLCDKLSVPELVALLKRCDLVIANDTSVMHLGAAVGTAVVAFFGPTAPFQYGPGDGNHLVFYRDLYCSPCVTNYNLKVSRCQDPVCIRTITVDEVLAGIEARFLTSPAPLRAVTPSRPGTPPARRVAAG